jgi:ubiquinone/menaquinone biosynthesis C-methylase UbiE
MNTSTGERLETFIFNANTAEHLHRYAVAMELCSGKKILDIACGDGYGSKLLSFVAAEVLGVDIDLHTIEQAKNKYQNGNISFLVGSANKIPVENETVDVVVSFETLEHHNLHREMFSEIKRVLKKGGVLLISTPDKLNYSDKHSYTNPFHVKELYKSEFESLVNYFFLNTEIFSQKYSCGSLIINDLSTNSNFKIYSGDFNSLAEHNFSENSIYNICLASDSILPLISNSFFDASNIQNKLQKMQMDNLKNDYEKSFSFRVGKMITAPFRFLKRSLAK